MLTILFSNKDSGEIIVPTAEINIGVMDTKVLLSVPIPIAEISIEADLGDILVVKQVVLPVAEIEITAIVPSVLSIAFIPVVEINIGAVVDSYVIFTLSNFKVNTGLGTDNQFIINHPIKDSLYHLIKFQYGIYVDAVLSILNEVKGTMEGVTSGNAITFRNSLIRGDGTFDQLMLLNNLPNDVNGVQKLLQIFSNETTGIETLKNTLSSAEITAIQTLSNTFDTVDYVSSYLFVKQSLIDLETARYTSESFGVKIYIDNIQSNNLIGNDTIEISFSQNSIHNEITIFSISQELFDLADPSINPGTPRIEVQIGNRVLFFLLEKREGSGADFTLWGRDQTARDSSPWSLSSSLYLSEQKLASEVVAEVTNYSAVDWDIDLYDWMLPETFEAEGTPTEILSSIAQEIGGIVRAQDDGSFLIRKKYTTRPINMPSAIADITYLANQVVDFSHSKVTGDHYNIVSVTSNVLDSILAQIEVEDLPEDDNTRYQGRTSFVRVFLTNSDESAYDSYVTDGIISLVGSAVQEEFEEIVEFKEGVAETTYPIYDIDDSNDYALSVEWIGEEGTIIDWNQYSTTLTLDDFEAFRLAKITYTIEFQRYELSGHDVEELLAVFFYTDTPNLNVLVITSKLAFDENGVLIDKTGDTITTDNLQVDSTAAVARGTAWIDDNKYDRYEHGFTSPYSDLALDGNIAWIDCSRIGLAGNYYISDVGITISGAMVINTLKVTQWQV